MTTNLKTFIAMLALGIALVGGALVANGETFAGHRHPSGLVSVAHQAYDAHVVDWHNWLRSEAAHG